MNDAHDADNKRTIDRFQTYLRIRSVHPTPGWLFVLCVCVCARAISVTLARRADPRRAGTTALFVPDYASANAFLVEYLTFFGLTCLLYTSPSPRD